MTTALIGIVGVFFLGMGCVALVAPAFVPRQFGMSIDGEPASPQASNRVATPADGPAATATATSAGDPHVDKDTGRGGDAGRAEVRAVYGGFGLAMAAVLGLALTDDGLRSGIVLAVAAALAGMAAGRVLSALLGDRTRFYPNWFYCGVEALAAAALLFAA